MGETVSCSSVDDAAISLAEMMSLKWKEQGTEDAAKSLSLDGQVLPTSSYSAICTGPTDASAHISVYSYYEIDHSKLPSKSPYQLKSIRIVMVTEKSKSRVAVRFPSFHSLRAHLNDSSTRKPEGKTLPSLDEKCAMEPNVAAEVLHRRIPPHEIGENRNSWSFWAVSSSNVNEVVLKKGLCWSELKSSEMVTWGKRKRVQFLNRYVEEKNEEGFSLSFVKDDENDVEKQDQEKEEDEENMVSDESGDVLNLKQKRKNDVSVSCIRPKLEKTNQITVVHRHGKKKKAVKNSINRWSKERYKSAEVNMLKIMKEKGAIYGNPVLRPALRAEARKLIGDTGLLDHLLKHMAGKVAPGGQERFMRRHNADGAMEYWLESADLVSIRKDAGVKDPYWTPPHGWKPGDSPSQDPVCAREIRQLKEEMAKIRREMEELVSKREEDDMAIVATPSSCVTSQNLEHDSFLLPLREMYADLMNKKAKLEEQLMEISQSLSGMEREMVKLKSISVEEPNKPESPPRPPAITCGTNEETKKGDRLVITSDEKQEDDETKPKTKIKTATAAVAAENKAAKIERLKSGFRICKPQGTFLWPNMALLSPNPAQTQASINKRVVPLEDLLVVPTPPSVSSSTTSAPVLHHHPHPHTSPVKPVAERRLPVAAASSPIPPLPLESSGGTKTSLINLNEVPSNNQNDQSDASPSRLTYQRRNNNVAAAVEVPRITPGRKEEDEMRHWEKEETKGKILGKSVQQQWECSSSSAASSSSSSTFSIGLATWLGLASPSIPFHSNPKRA